jgi:transposase-like protein
MNIVDERAPEVMADEGRRDSKGRVTMDGERRRALLDEFLASGLSQARFARKAGLTYSTFAGWVQKHRKHAASGGPTIPPARRSLKSLKRKTPDKRPMMPARIEFREVAVPLVRGEPEGVILVKIPGGIEARCADVTTAARLIRALREER